MLAFQQLTAPTETSQDPLFLGTFGEVSLVPSALGDEFSVEDLFGLLEASPPVQAPTEDRRRLVAAGLAERAQEKGIL